MHAHPGKLLACAALQLFLSMLVKLPVILPLFFPCTPTQPSCLHVVQEIAWATLRCPCCALLCCAGAGHQAVCKGWLGPVPASCALPATVLHACSHLRLPAVRPSVFTCLPIALQCVIIQGETKPLCPEGTPQDIM